MHKPRSRQQAGRLAKASGDLFERVFESVCRIQGVVCERIPNGMRMIGRGKVIRLRSPFDYVLCYMGRAAFIDLKSISEGNFTYSKITRHQVDSLKRLSPGGVSGYIIALANEVYFFDVSFLEALKPKESLDAAQGIYLGKRSLFDVRRIFQ